MSRGDRGQLDVRLVDRVERLGGLAQEARRFRLGEGALALHLGGEIEPVDRFHRDEPRAAGLATFVDGNDMLMLQQGGLPDFVLVFFAQGRVAGDFLGQDLESYLPTAFDIHRLVEASLGPGRNRRRDFILADAQRTLPAGCWRFRRHDTTLAWGK